MPKNPDAITVGQLIKQLSRFPKRQRVHLLVNLNGLIAEIPKKDIVLPLRRIEGGYIDLISGDLQVIVTHKKN